MSALTAAAREAFLYTLPLIEIAAVRARGLAVGSPMNAFAAMRNLADHRARAVTTPNNDTLYATAQLDLSEGPVTLTVPASGERYVSLQLMDAWSNSFAVLGTRTTGPDGGTFTLVGPGEAAAVGPGVIRAPTRHVWALARILVAGPEDLAAARLVQAGFTAQGPAPPPVADFARRSDPWPAYFASADLLMSQNPPPASDVALLRRIAPLGLGMGTFDPHRFSAEDGAHIAEGLEDGRRAARSGGGLSGEGFIAGWAYPRAKLGDFGQDYMLRAAVALGGLAALPLVEATYLRAGHDGQGLFDGTRNWRLHIPADHPIPVESFWSLSLYEATPDKQFFFTDNPINRYAIGDRTPGLAWNADGSLDLWIGQAQPGAERVSNWLPAPAGPFALFMRAYLPRPQLLDGSYRLPPVQEI